MSDDEPTQRHSLFDDEPATLRHELPRTEPQPVAAEPSPAPARRHLLPAIVLGVLVAAVVAVGAVLLLGGGSDRHPQAATTPTAVKDGATLTAEQKAARSQFVRHAGLALAALRKYVYEPFKSGSFTDGGVVGAFRAIQKAGSAVNYAIDQLGQASDAAKGDPALSAASAKVDDLLAHVKSLASGVTSGQFDPADLAPLLTDADAIVALAKAAGAEVTTPRDVPDF